MAQKKSNPKIWITLACILVAVILCGIMTQGFTDWNPYCWFGHKYKDNVCVRCGKDKPIENEDEPKAALSEPYRISAASARLLNASASSSQLYPSDCVSAGTTTISRLNNLDILNSGLEWEHLRNRILINLQRPQQNNIILSGTDSFKISTSHEDANGSGYYDVGYVCFSKVGSDVWYKVENKTQGNNVYEYSITEKGTYKLCFVEDSNDEEDDSSCFTAHSPIVTVQYEDRSELPAAPTPKKIDGRGQNTQGQDNRHGGGEGLTVSQLQPAGEQGHQQHSPASAEKTVDKPRGGA